jgi:hypothetical protein
MGINPVVIPVRMKEKMTPGIVSDIRYASETVDAP